jgi:hypothetical protein
VHALYFVRWWTNLLEQNQGFLMIFLKKFSHHLEVWILEAFENPVLKSTNRRRQKKSPAQFQQKIKTAFRGKDYFLLLKLKMRYFVQESATKFHHFFIFCKKKFSKILVF